MHDLVIEDIDMFFKKVKIIKESGVLVYVTYVAAPHLISRIKEYKRRGEDIGVPLIMNPLIGHLSGIDGVDPHKKYPFDYTDEGVKYLKDHWDTPHSYKLLVEAC